MVGRTLVVGLLFLVGVAAAESPQVRLPARKDFHLYLLVGQSNMAGRGRVAAEDRKPLPRVVSFSKEGTWVPAVDPLHFDKPRVVGVGLGRSFAIEVAGKNPAVTIGLVPCAVGGSPISSWEPGGFHPGRRRILGTMPSVGPGPR